MTIDDALAVSTNPHDLTVELKRWGWSPEPGPSLGGTFPARRPGRDRSRVSR